MTSRSDSSNSFFRYMLEDGEEKDNGSEFNSPQINQQHLLISKDKENKIRKQSHSSLFSQASYFNNSIQHITLIQDISFSFFSYLRNLNPLNVNKSMSCFETTRPPIDIITKPTEYLPGVFDVIKSDNVFINKVISAFAILFCEIDNLLPHNGYDALLPLILYGETPIETSSIPTEGEETQIARLLPVIESLSEVVRQLLLISINLLNQLVALYNPQSKTYKDSFHLIALNKPFDYLGKIFSFFNAIDLIMQGNSDLMAHWKKYRYMLHKCKDNLAQIDVTNEEARKLDRKINKYASVISGKLLDQSVKTIQENFEEVSNGHTERSNDIIRKRLIDYFKKYKQLYSEIGKLTETNERLQLFQLMSLIPYLHVNQSKEYNEIYILVWSMQHKLTHINVITGLNINIEAFLLKYKPSDNVTYYLIPKKPQETALELYFSLTKNIQIEMNNLTNQVMTWLTRMGSNLFDKQTNEEESPIAISKLQIQLILNGLILLNQVRRKAIDLMSLHSILKKNITRGGLKSLIEALKLSEAVEMQFNNSMAQIAQHIPLLFSVIQNRIKDELALQKESVEKKSRELSSFQSDLLSSIDIVSENLRMAPSPLRSSVNAICFDIVNSSTISEQAREDIKYSMWQLELLSNLTNHIKVGNNYSLYWIRDLIPDCFKEILRHPKEDHLTYFMSSLTKSASLLSSALHKGNKEFIQSYQKTISCQFEQSFLLPVALEIDRDIRLQVALNNINELANENLTSVNYSLLLSIHPVTLFDMRIDIKGYVEEYLNQSFYDLNCLNPNDWKTYQQMKAFAKMKYNLSLLDTFLPFEVIDKGIGLLEIVKSLQKFISTYHYDLLNQLFIEQVPIDTQMISIVSPKQIANTFDTHSIGIVNSVINKIFQLIGVKLKGLVAIFVDDRISSIIYKEKMFWDECASNYNKVYPYSKGHKFLKENEELVSSLILITTQIGNAIGLVRTIKTALMSYVDSSVKYSSSSLNDISSLLSAVSFEEGSNSTSNERENFKRVFTDSQGQLTRIIQLLSNDQERNYLNLLVSSFDKAFNLPEIDFYHILLPPCFLYHVESSLAATDTLYKKNGHYGNDGLLLGIAYLNKVFKQEHAFESLSWFDSVNSKYEQLKAKYGKDETKRMALKRIDLFQKEFQLVSCLYQTSLMLFND